MKSLFCFFLPCKHFYSDRRWARQCRWQNRKRYVPIAAVHLIPNDECTPIKKNAHRAGLRMGWNRRSKKKQQACGCIYGMVHIFFIRLIIPHRLLLVESNGEKEAPQETHTRTKRV